MRRKYHRPNREQMQEQLRKIEKLLEKSPMRLVTLQKRMKLARKPLLHRLRILRNDGKVRYYQRERTTFWSLGTMPPLEVKPKSKHVKPEIMLRWGGYAA